MVNFKLLTTLFLSSLPLTVLAHGYGNIQSSPSKPAFHYYGQIEAGYGFSKLGKNQNMAWNSPLDAYYDTYAKNNVLHGAFFGAIEVGMEKQIANDKSFDLGIALQDGSHINGGGEIYSGGFKENHWYNYKYNVIPTSAMLRGRFLYKFNPQWLGFVDIGGGISRINIDNADISPVAGNCPPPSPYFRKFSNAIVTNFAWQAGLGVGYKLNTNTSMLLGYRYADFGNASIQDIYSTKRLKLGTVYTNQIYLALHLAI